jgi:hypothetical protein
MAPREHELDPGGRNRRCPSAVGIERLDLERRWRCPQRALGGHHVVVAVDVAADEDEAHGRGSTSSSLFCRACAARHPRGAVGTSPSSRSASAWGESHISAGRISPTGCERGRRLVAVERCQSRQPSEARPDSLRCVAPTRAPFNSGVEALFSCLRTGQSPDVRQHSRSPHRCRGADRPDVLEHRPAGTRSRAMRGPKPLVHPIWIGASEDDPEPEVGGHSAGAPAPSLRPSERHDIGVGPAPHPFRNGRP